MQRKVLFILIGVALLCSFPAGFSQAEEPLSYSFFQKKGLEAFRDGRYADATAFLKEALRINPSAQETMYFLSIVKRLQHGLVTVVDYEGGLRDLKYQASDLIRRYDREGWLWVDEAVAQYEKDLLASPFLSQESTGREKALEALLSREALTEKRADIESTLGVLKLVADEKSKMIGEIPFDASIKEKITPKQTLYFEEKETPATALAPATGKESPAVLTTKPEAAPKVAKSPAKNLEAERQKGMAVIQDLKIEQEKGKKVIRDLQAEEKNAKALAEQLKKQRKGVEPSAVQEPQAKPASKMVKEQGPISQVPPVNVTQEEEAAGEEPVKEESIEGESIGEEPVQEKPAKEKPVKEKISKPQPKKVEPAAEPVAQSAIKESGLQPQPPAVQVPQEEVSSESSAEEAQLEDLYIKSLQQEVVEEVEKKTPSAQVVTPGKAKASEKAKPKSAAASSGEPETFWLTDELWNSAAEFNLQIEIGRSVILDGKDIERFLVITPRIIKVEKIDKDRILVTAEQWGRTPLLVWESHGRWTFNVETIFPVRGTEEALTDIRLEENDRFRFDYSNDWSSYYSDETDDDLARKTLSFTQRMLVYGQSPYGAWDSSVTFEKLGKETEATGYSVGLTDGKIGPYKDFSIRGFDINKSLSPLTLSGKYFRGMSFEKESFNKNLEWSFLWGRDRGTYFYLTPGVLDKQDFYISGGRAVLFPRTDHQYAVNYVEGWGSDQPDFLKDKVISLETLHKIGSTELSAEMAYDEEDYARTANADFVLSPEMDLSLNFRDFEKGFATPTALLSSQGEVGGIVSYLWHPESFDLNAVFNIYKNRLNVNDDHEYAYNHDWNISLRKPFADNSSWNSDLYWIGTPGTISPRKEFRFSNTYSRNFPFLGEDRIGSAFIGHSYQRSRYPLSPLSEYDRHGLFSGFRVPVVKDLAYYLNYEYYFVDPMLDEDTSQPNVMTTGLNYQRYFTDQLRGTVDIAYRNEQDTDSSLSFLSGEDSVSLRTGLSYFPTQDINLYIDGSARKIWPDSEARNDYLDADVRVGARLSWEVPFRWNATGSVGGVVFKDINANGRQDPGERGISKVLVEVGKEQTTTDDQGRYLIQARGKSVQVGVDFDSVPAGYVFTTPLYQKVDIIDRGLSRADFGLTARSGIYGVVFYDANQSRKPDSGDKLLQDVRIIMDGEQESFTDGQGSYSFANLEPGKHTIMIDINSIPLEYLPMIKLENTIDIREGTTYILHIPLKMKSGE